MLLRRLGILAAIGAVVLSGCGNNGLGTLGTVTSQTAFRFLNGSPDLGNVDIFLGATSGSKSAANLAYGAMSSISTVNTQDYTVTVTSAGSTTTKLSCPIKGPGAQTRYTVVIAGKVAGGTTTTGLQCQIFPETYYSIPTGQFLLQFHQASPALNALVTTAPAGATPPPSTVAFGLYPAGTTNWQLNSGTGTFAVATGGIANGTPTNVLVSGVSSAPGVGVYVARTSPNPPTPGAAGVFATTTPSASIGTGASGLIGTSNDSTKANFFPITTTSSAGAVTIQSNNYAVYVIDGTTTTAALVGEMD